MSRPLIDFEAEATHINDLLLHPPAVAPKPAAAEPQLLTAEFLNEMAAYLWERGIDDYAKVLREKVAYCGRTAIGPIKNPQSYVTEAIRQYCRGMKKVRVYIADPDDVDETEQQS